jgi:small subunit ribosomal protein S6
MAAAATPDYEFTYILDGVLAEDQIKDLVGRINKLITSNGGEVIDIDEWGMRQLAYPIRNRNNGYYVNLYFTSGPDVPAQLERTLRIEESVLRFLTLRLDAKMKRHYFKYKAQRDAAPTPKVEKSEETVPTSAQPRPEKASEAKPAPEAVVETTAAPEADTKTEAKAEVEA